MTVVDLGSIPVSRWRDALEGASPDEAVQSVGALHRAWIAGELGTGPTDARDLAEADRVIGRFFQALPEPLRAPLHVERGAQTESEVRRWCWAPGWFLLSQDEDLMLFDDRWVVPLLEEAAARCTKRDYAIEIVEHQIRDHAHHAVWLGAEALDARLALARDWIPAARAADALELVGYLERLASYTERRKVARADVDARVLDLRRCRPDPHLAPEVRREGRHWRARLDRAGLKPATLVIEAGTGRMWGESEKRRR